MKPIQVSKYMIHFAKSIPTGVHIPGPTGHLCYCPKLEYRRGRLGVGVYLLRTDERGGSKKSHVNYK